VTQGSYWIGWAAITLCACGYLGAVLTRDGGETRTMFVPGPTTSGHYQIERACESCHTPFEGVTNDACLACHGAELTAVDDSHPKSKFTDPRNAALVDELDATRCVTCHAEHVPDMTRPMGVTLPDDYCYTCHAEVGTERPSHAGMAFDTCASAGCHNYHDNTALYEDFLASHAGEPRVTPRPLVPQRTGTQRAVREPGASAGAIQRLSADAPHGAATDAALVAEWEQTTHARAGVNCTGCHTAAGGSPDAGAWVATPGERECASCHDTEVAGFLEGRHGMRVKAGLERMTPALARLPMKRAAFGRELSCASCHPAHGFDTRAAAVDACLGCHDDRHSQAYVGSPHHALWQLESSGRAAAGTGVSCATCHLPRQHHQVGGDDRVLVQHNQNLNLRPNEKMTRSACLACHGLGFTLDALADPGLIATSFRGSPTRPVASIDMAAGRRRRTPD
jgi:uncharacterized cupin superfamily protein